MRSVGDWQPFSLFVFEATSEDFLTCLCLLRVPRQPQKAVEGNGVIGSLLKLLTPPGQRDCCLSLMRKWGRKTLQQLKAIAVFWQVHRHATQPEQ